MARPKPEAKASHADWGPIEVGPATVQPGKQSQFVIPLARLVTGTPVDLPVTVLRGARPGPAVWVSAAIHGDEINGVEIVRQVLGILKPESMAGTLIAVPIVNVFGFIHQERYLPDRRDLNRCFPGSPRGSLGSRLAATFLQEIVRHCDYGIDLHTAARSRTNLAQIRAHIDDPETRRCAFAFGAPVVVNSRVRDGSLREAATRRGAHVLVFEGGEALRFDPDPIRIGVRGVIRVLASLDMWKAGRGQPSRSVVAESSRWIRARRSGMLHLEVKLGEHVERDAVVGLLVDAFGAHRTKICAPTAGLVIGHATNPLVHRGAAVVHLAKVAENDQDT